MSHVIVDNMIMFYCGPATYLVIPSQSMSAPVSPDSSSAVPDCVLEWNGPIPNGYDAIPNSMLVSQPSSETDVRDGGRTDWRPLQTRRTRTA